MPKTIFFKKKDYYIKKLFPGLKFRNNSKINDVRPLDKSNKFYLSFFDSIKYKEQAINTKASYCITTQKLAHILPDTCFAINVEDVLLSTAKVTKKF